MQVRRHALLALTVGLAGAAVACKRGDSSTPAPNARAGDPAVAEVVFGVTHNITVNGVRRASLHADTALVGDSSTTLELRRVRLTLYSAAGDSVGALAAPAATYDLRSRRVSARGGVTVLGAGGRRTSPATAVYDGTSGRVTEGGAAGR